MDPVTIAVLIGAAIQAIGGIVGYIKSSNAHDAADQILQHARNAYGGITADSVQKAAAELVGPTQLAKIQQDPRYRAAQQEALAELARINRDGGYTLEDRANLAEVQNQTAAEASSAQRAMLASLARRGQLGGGAEIGASLANQQAAANRNSQAGLRVAADAQRRALEALRDRANLAGQMSRDDYARARDAASAQDAIDKFNNTERYQRAVDDYNRRLGMADRQYNMEADRANAVLGQGTRSANFAISASNNAGRTIQSAADHGAFGKADSQPNQPEQPANPYSGYPNDDDGDL